MMGVLDGVPTARLCPTLLKEATAAEKRKKQRDCLKDLVLAMLGAPHQKRDGMERKDLFKATNKIFKCQGAALRNMPRSQLWFSW